MCPQRRLLDASRLLLCSGVLHELESKQPWLAAPQLWCSFIVAGCPHSDDGMPSCACKHQDNVRWALDMYSSVSKVFFFFVILSITRAGFCGEVL